MYLILQITQHTLTDLAFPFSIKYSHLKKEDERFCNFRYYIFRVFNQSLPLPKTREIRVAEQKREKSIQKLNSTAEPYWSPRAEPHCPRCLADWRACHQQETHGLVVSYARTMNHWALTCPLLHETRHHPSFRPIEA